ncbi:MAG: hypothetical protein B6245_04295 [Desulfobacteraceae bacterium 4572_88]|nr:MAG: hypothetical protein B6245_04295 [Desulfobacteraceae bacterium 4572_88]
MTVRHIVITLFVFFCLVAAVPTCAESDAVQKETARGEELFRMGDFEQAALLWEQTLSRMNAEKEPGVYSDITLRLAGAYQALGYHRKALSLLRSVSSFVEKSDEQYRKALFHSALGDLYSAFGNLGKASENLAKGVKHARASGDKRVLANVLNNAGNVFAATQGYGEAEAVYTKCLELLNELKDHPEPADLILKANALLNIARISFLNGRNEETELALQQALSQTDELPVTHEKAVCLISMGLLMREIQDKTERSEDKTLTIHRLFSSAAEIASELKNLPVMSHAYGYLGQLYESEKQYSDAMRLTRTAIFHAQNANLPQILYRWQWQMGRLFSAEGNIGEAVKAYQQSVSVLNPIRQELFRGHRSMEGIFDKDVKPVYLELAELLLRQAETVTDDNARESGLRQARDVMELLKTAELQNFFEDECVTATQKKVTRLDRATARTAIIYPIIFKDKVVVLLTLPDGMRQIGIPVNGDLLNKTVRQFRRHLQTRPNNRFMKDSKQLYDWLVRPLEKEFADRDIDTMIVAPDGVLRLVPFSALSDGKHFLVEKYAVGTIPAITLTASGATGDKKTEILIAGLSQSVQGASPLPNVPEELEDIKTIMEGRVVLQDENYTVENLTSEFKKEAYSIVHLATHGVFGGTPEDTFLLTYDGRLNIGQLEDLIGLGRFREQPVDLLTLSACQTALGDERAALGLAGVAIKAGVSSAIATLWFVDDEATSLTVREFYRQLKTPGISKAKALQNAQKKLISQQRYWHPAYWSPFLLIGNWL